MVKMCIMLLHTTHELHSGSAALALPPPTLSGWGNTFLMCCTLDLIETMLEI